MKYVGSKDKIFKYIYPIIKENIDNEIVWLEPFVGGANMIDKVKDFKYRIGNDSNYYLIEMFNALKNGWLPPQSVTKEEYYNIKSNIKSYPPQLVAFVGFPCSFGGKWFGGYAHDEVTHRNYASEGYRNLINQLPNIKDVMFINKSYSDIFIPVNTIIYCDPPYYNTVSYKDGFNHSQFWDWCRLKSKTNKIFISEYKAPSDFKCIFEYNHKTTLDHKNNGDLPRTEKLFTIGV